MAILKHEEYLQKIFLNINDWLKFAEAKNFGLLTLSSAVIIGFGQTECYADSVILKVGNYIFIPFAVLSLIISLVSLFPILTKIEKGQLVKSWITCLSSIIDKENLFENIHFYGYIRNLDTEEFERKFLQKVSSAESLSGYEKDLVTQIVYNSRITWLKYQLFKIAAFIFGLGIVVSIILYVILLVRSRF